MADRAPLVTPFRGVRFTETARLSALLAPPYDVISAADRQRLAGADPHNVVRFILPESDGDRYEAAGEEAGRVKTKSMLEEHLYEWGETIGSNTIEFHISNLRKKLPPDFIHTIRGIGYTIKKADASQ